MIFVPYICLEMCILNFMQVSLIPSSSLTESQSCTVPLCVLVRVLRFTAVSYRLRLGYAAFAKRSLQCLYTMTWIFLTCAFLHLGEAHCNVCVVSSNHLPHVLDCA